jgi:GntR family transcriptional regulator, transcriptional repressor for pyruvate dehydrogenase complex
MRQASIELTKLDSPRAETTVERIAQRLLDSLLSGAIEPGDRIPSVTRLSEQLGVGRSSVREAVKLLETRGVLEVRQSSGCYFKGNDPGALVKTFEWALLFGTKDITDFVEARWHIEILLVELAAQRRSASDIEAIKAALDTMRDAQSPDVFSEADLAFHFAIAEAANNAVLRDVLRGIRSLTLSWISRNLTRVTTPQIAYVDHMPIFEAIVAQDSRQARLAMHEHMVRATGRLVQTMEAAQGAALQKRIDGLAAV